MPIEYYSYMTENAIISAPIKSIYSDWEPPKQILISIQNGMECYYLLKKKNMYIFFYEMAR